MNLEHCCSLSLRIEIHNTLGSQVLLLPQEPATHLNQLPPVNS
jgi:hypothetical protein